jgi:hypothetical protein
MENTKHVRTQVRSTRSVTQANSDGIDRPFEESCHLYLDGQKNYLATRAALVEPLMAACLTRPF